MAGGRGRWMGRGLGKERQVAKENRAPKSIIDYVQMVGGGGEGGGGDRAGGRGRGRDGGRSEKSTCAGG